MSTAMQRVERDERTVEVENASYKWAFLTLAFALLIDVAVRGFVHGQGAWDLMFLVIVTGGLSTAYQQFHHVLGKGWLWSSVVAAIIGLLAAALAAAVAG